MTTPAEALAKYSEDELYTLYDYLKNIADNDEIPRSRRMARIELIHVADALDRNRWVVPYNLDQVLQFAS